jgi:hypothetical protein
LVVEQTHEPGMLGCKRRFFRLSHGSDVLLLLLLYRH